MHEILEREKNISDPKQIIADCLYYTWKFCSCKKLQIKSMTLVAQNTNINIPDVSQCQFPGGKEKNLLLIRFVSTMNLIASMEEKSFLLSCSKLGRWPPENLNELLNFMIEMLQ